MNAEKKRHLGILLMGLLTAGFLSCKAPPENQKLPHVVFILADDMGWGDVAAYNPESLTPTPHIDGLSREGLSFMDAHSGGAVCTPTRYGIMTGRFYWRTHKKHSLVMPYDPPVIPPERMTWAQVMQDKGYRTGYVGKWHLGLWYPSLKTEGRKRQYTMNEGEVDFSRPVVGGPTELGFNFFFGTAGCSTSDSPYCFIRNDRWEGTPSVLTPEDMNAQPGVVAGLMEPGWDQEKVDMTLTREAVAFIEGHRQEALEKPLFLYFALSAPHIPWITPEFIRGTSREGPRGDLNALVDWSVGELVKALEAQGLLEDTLLIFTSDNGPRRAANGHRSAGPFRGYKNTPYEGGHRVPFIVRWPGKTMPASRSQVPISLNDMTATFAALLNYPMPDGAAEDSINILPALLDSAGGQLQRPALIADTGSHVSDRASFSIRQGAWKLLEIVPRPAEVSQDIRYELYDLDKDPYETTDLSETQPEILQDMKALLGACKQQGLRFMHLPE